MGCKLCPPSGCLCNSCWHGCTWVRLACGVEHEKVIPASHTCTECAAQLIACAPSISTMVVAISQMPNAVLLPMKPWPNMPMVMHRVDRMSAVVLLVSVVPGPWRPCGHAWRRVSSHHCQHHEGQGEICESAGSCSSRLCTRMAGFLVAAKARVRCPAVEAPCLVHKRLGCTMDCMCGVYTGHQLLGWQCFVQIRFYVFVLPAHSPPDMTCADCFDSRFEACTPHGHYSCGLLRKGLQPPRVPPRMLAEADGFFMSFRHAA